MQVRAQGLLGEVLLPQPGRELGDVRFLERETGFERGVYSGVVTVALVIPDVRVGDTLSIAYLVEGSNPVFGGHRAGRPPIVATGP